MKYHLDKKVKPTNNKETIPVNIDAIGHVTGTSMYVDDIPVMQGTLFIKVFASPVAHGIIEQIDFSEAEQAKGVVKIFTHKDIPGKNEIGGIIEDEPLLAAKEVHFQGQPIVLVVAESEEEAEDAVSTISVTIKELPVITDPKEAYEKGQVLANSRTFANGDTTTAFKKPAIFLKAKRNPVDKNIYT